MVKLLFLLHRLLHLLLFLLPPPLPPIWNELHIIIIATPTVIKAPGNRSWVHHSEVVLEVKCKGSQWMDVLADHPEILMDFDLDV